MTRNHMHFAAGLADENTVTSGKFPPFDYAMV